MGDVEPDTEGAEMHRIDGGDCVAGAKDGEAKDEEEEGDAKDYCNGDDYAASRAPPMVAMFLGVHYRRSGSETGVSHLTGTVEPSDSYVVPEELLIIFGRQSNG